MEKLFPFPVKAIQKIVRVLIQEGGEATFQKITDIENELFRRGYIEKIDVENNKVIRLGQFTRKEINWFKNQYQSTI